MNSKHEPDETHQLSEHLPSEEKFFLSSDKLTLPKPRRPVLDAIRPFYLFTLVTSSIFLLGSFIFIFFLWRTSINAVSGYDAPKLWRTLVDRRWIIRAVTTASVVIRTSVALQIGLVTPMIASLLLERAGARIGDLPLLSILRSVSTSPHQLIQPIVHQSLEKTSLGLNGLLLVAALTSIVSQFTSTILLLDFGDRSLHSTPTFSNVNFGLNILNSRYSEYVSDYLAMNYSDESSGTVDPYSGVNYWKSSPSSYLRFAELHSPASPEEGVADTGMTYRAFLPFSSSDSRRTLRNFTGVATVLNFRTVCVRPKLTIKGSRLLNWDLIGLDGFAEWEREYPMLSHRPASAPRTNQTNGFITKTSFNCTIAVDSSRIRSMGFWRTSLCRTSSDATFLNGPVEGLNDPEGIWTKSYILFNATGSGAEWTDAGKLNTWEGSSNGSWTFLSAKSLNNNPSSFSATMCFINPSPSNYEVNIWGRTEGVEPSLTWNSATRQFNTEAVRRLYGSLNSQSTSEERGIFTLGNHPNWTTQLAALKFNISTLDFVWPAIMDGFDSNNADIPTREGGALLTPWSDSIAQGIHRAHIAVFQDVIRSTHNPALALQTLFTILTQSAYYDFLPQFDVAAPAQYTVSTMANIPHQWKGFTIVVVVLGIHFLVIGITTVLFLAGTRVSMLGNAWQAVAQVVELVDKDILEDAGKRREDEVVKMLRISGRANKVIKVS